MILPAEYSSTKTDYSRSSPREKISPHVSCDPGDSVLLDSECHFSGKKIDASAMMPVSRYKSEGRRNGKIKAVNRPRPSLTDNKAAPGKSSIMGVPAFEDGNKVFTSLLRNNDRQAAIESLSASSPSVSLRTTGVEKLWEKGYTGKGVTIAVIDSGIHPHGDFIDPSTGKSRILAFVDLVGNKQEPYDDLGHGTSVAGIAAGNGSNSESRFKGAAPDAGIVGIKAFARDWSADSSDVVKAIQWAIENKEKYNIRVLAMSLGGPVECSYKDDPVAQAVERAYEAGIVPVVAAGNEGNRPRTICTPGNDPLALTVGAVDTMGTVDKGDDDLPKFSSRGPTMYDGLSKPDIVFPGVNITAPLSIGSVFDDNSDYEVVEGGYVTMSGTSMAAPGVAGVVADLIQANPSLTPADIKNILSETAESVATYLSDHAQGKGIINAPEALEKALAITH